MCAMIIFKIETKCAIKLNFKKQYLICQNDRILPHFINFKIYQHYMPLISNAHGRFEAQIIKGKLLFQEINKINVFTQLQSRKKKRCKRP